MTLLKTAAVVEITTLLVLLTNLVTAHVATVASVVGPVHGAAYLMVVAAVALLPGAPRAVRWWSMLPGLGGLFALRLLHRERSGERRVERE